MKTTETQSGTSNTPGLPADTTELDKLLRRLTALQRALDSGQMPGGQPGAVFGACWCQEDLIVRILLLHICCMADRHGTTGTNDPGSQKVSRNMPKRNHCHCAMDLKLSWCHGTRYPDHTETHISTQGRHERSKGHRY